MKERIFAIPKEQIVRLVPHSAGCIATDRIMVDGSEVGYMYREETDREHDMGWRFFSGDEDDEYMSNSENMTVYLVNTVANYDPDILPYLDTPAPCAFEKVKGSRKYNRVPFPHID